MAKSTIRKSNSLRIENAALRIINQRLLEACKMQLRTLNGQTMRFAQAAIEEAEGFNKA